MSMTTTTTAPTNGLVPANLDQAMRLATMMARGKMMPEHLKNEADALMVIEQSMRWNMSPFAVAQCTYNIKGKLLFSGTIVAAAIENSGAIVGLMDYQFSGEGSTRVITVSATRKGETEPRSITHSFKDAKTTNEMWIKQPDQQLVYSGSRVWARRWTPGVMLGVYVPEEFNTIEANAEKFDGPTLTATAEPAPETAAEPPKRTIKQWLDNLEEQFVHVTCRDEVDAIVSSPDVMRAAGSFTNGAKARLDALIQTALLQHPGEIIDGTIEGEMHADDAN